MIIEIKDKYNENKTWVIKHTADRHYYLNQKIRGKMFYSRFQRISKLFINTIIGEVKINNGI